MTVATCTNGDVELAYQSFGPADGSPLLLIMGVGAPMSLWHDDLCAALVDRGFRVARFDNRDAGRSSRVGEPYTLADMALDAVAVLDALRWPAAHLVGASLGGMIGQVMAVHHGTRVHSLTCVSSAPCHSWRVSRPRIGTLLRLAALGRKAGTGRDAAGEDLVNLFRIVGSPSHPLEEDWLREIGRQSHDHGHDPAGGQRQLRAIRAAGDRRAELSAVRVPTLVIHGEADPMQSVRAAKATAGAIPGARLVTYPGMGHDLPRKLWPAITNEIHTTATAARCTDPTGPS
jgi:pimeloyl-ACP methyl ester carboxylesterase